MDVVINEVLVDEVSLGEVRIEISIHEKNGWSVWLTARDTDNRRIWRTPFTDAKGNMRVYISIQEAMQDAQHQLKNIISVPKKQFTL